MITKKVKLLKYIFIIGSLFLYQGCKNHAQLDVVKSVDLNKYAGKWYEIARLPNSFEEGCTCVTAEYFLTDEDYIKVVNTCREVSVNGEINQATGKAFIVQGSNNAKLEVQFFWPFRGDYWIIELADDYSWAVVGEQSREYLWILARTAQIDENLYYDLTERAKNKGFNIDKLIRTVQECKN
jgi:apolipoprotein D and lipocalin family protein